MLRAGGRQPSERLHKKVNLRVLKVAGFISTADAMFRSSSLMTTSTFALCTTVRPQTSDRMQFHPPGLRQLVRYTCSTIAVSIARAPFLRWRAVERSPRPHPSPSPLLACPPCRFAYLFACWAAFSSVLDRICDAILAYRTTSWRTVHRGYTTASWNRTRTRFWEEGTLGS